MMKKTIAVAAAALAVLASFAEDGVFRGMTEAQVNALDKAEWSGMGKLKGDKQKEYAALVAMLDEFNGNFDKAIKDKVFVNPSKSATMQELMQTLQKRLGGRGKRGEAAPERAAGGDDPQALKALDALAVMLERIDGSARPAVMELVDTSLATQLPQRFSKWSQAIERANAWQHSKTLAEFDEKFGKFMKILKTADAKIISDCSGTMMLKLSGLDKFANADCRKEAFFDRDLRTIDSYLYSLRDVSYKAHKEYLELFEARWNKALAEVRKDWAYFRQHGLNLAPADRKKVDELFWCFGTLLEDAENYIAQAKKLLSSVEATDTNAEVYKLRNCLIGPNRAFYCSGSVKGDGCPGYSRRVRVALEDCKKAYLDTYKRLTGNAGKWE